MAYAVPPSTAPEFALFYQSAAESLGTAAFNTLGFDVALPNNSPIVTNVYTASPDQSIFIVNASGLYQLEAHITVNPAGATWTNPQRQLYFTVTRAGGMSPGAIATLSQSSSQVSGVGYSIGVVGSFVLYQGDQVQVVHNQNGVTGNPTARGLENGFDLNTWCSFTFIKQM